MTEERWKPIHEFSSYAISNLGNVYNHGRDKPVLTSLTNYGHVRVNLVDDWGRRHTRSVALLVAEAFCKKPDVLSDAVTILDGVSSNVYADNLVWRPTWFAWKYARQMHVPRRRHYEILPVINLIEDVTYNSIVECGMTEGLLFNDIWRSTYSGDRIYPHFCVYQILK